MGRAQVHLSNFLVPTWCAPSRAAFLTGRNAWDVGVTASVMEPFPRHVTLLPELLRREGYRTALVGKNHIIPDRRAHPAGVPGVGHGFDHFYGFYGGMTGYWTRSNWQVPHGGARNRRAQWRDRRALQPGAIAGRAGSVQ